jgi:hypothetical protein
MGVFEHFVITNNVSKSHVESFIIDNFAGTATVAANRSKGAHGGRSLNDRRA